MGEQETMRRTYKYRLYPTATQAQALDRQLGFCCDLYNAALEQRRRAWRCGISLSLYDQIRQLPEIGRAGWLDGMNHNAARSALHRLDHAFAAFFRRCEAGDEPGYPRFRSRRRYDTLTWAWKDGSHLCSGRLSLQGVGLVKVKWHRKLPDDCEVRQVSIKRVNGRWYACFSLTMPMPVALASTGEAVGLDLGVRVFAALSTGELLAGPRIERQNARQVRRAQRRVERRRRGSRRRQKAVALLARQREHERNRRRDHAHKTARALVQRFDLIAHESLAIGNMVRSARGTLAEPGKHVRQKAGLNREIADQGWGLFLQLLSDKAEEAGRTVSKVAPAGTSLTCAEWGGADGRSRRDERFRCVACGHSDHADVNAARNILARALADEPRPGRGRQALTQDEEVCVA